MTVAIVCGGRSYGRVPIGTPGEQYRQAADVAAKQVFMLRETLDHVRMAHDLRRIVVGGADGADAIAARWAQDRTIPALVIRAQWRTFGRRAGPIRNAQMLKEGKPDFVIAFDGGAGTADMVRQAKAAGVEVLDYRGGAG